MISDPSQFLQRVVEEALARSGSSGDGHPDTGTLDNETLLAQALGERLAGLFNDRTEAPADEDPSWTDSPDISVILEHYEELIQRNSLLAAALGACECWGDVDGCEICRGEGTPGWCLPDRRLFARFVRPAVRALPNSPDKSIHGSPGKSWGMRKRQ